MGTRPCAALLQLVIIAGLASLTGCATAVWWGAPGNMHTKSLSVGLSKQQVQAMLGPPQRITAQQAGTLIVETWTYLKDVLTFHNGTLYSWNAAPTPADGQAGRTL